MTILVTGGAGFIGSNFIYSALNSLNEDLVNLDLLTYAGNLENLHSLESNNKHIFVKGDINDLGLLKELIQTYQPRAIINFAAESHVDRSILGPEVFINTNVYGVFRLLEASKEYWETLRGRDQEAFRFLQVSTDEVFGSLDATDSPFSEVHRYAPNSPYSASKASADHLVRAYNRTYGLPTLTTNCSNNYGPYQFPEKLIPLVLANALEEKTLPVYGDGKQIRDWLYVKDHCEALLKVIESGLIGETYNIGGNSELTNLDVIHQICSSLDNINPRKSGRSYKDLIEFVKDRPGHDRRYAVDATKLKNTLNWEPAETFRSGLRKTIDWYMNNQTWVGRVRSGQYREWVVKQYG